jgi:hypothetical protein
MAFISLMVIEGHFWDRGNTNESSNRNVVKAVVKRLLEGNFVCWGGCLITIPPRKEWSVALAEEHLSSRYYRPSDQGVSD